MKEDQLSLFGSGPVVDTSHAKRYEADDKTKIYDHLPDGWIVKSGTNTNPLGYVWICNNKPMFSGKYKAGLMKIDDLPERNGMKRE